MAPVAAVAAAVAAVLAAAYGLLRRATRLRAPSDLSVVREADDVTEIDRTTCAVRSVQSAEVRLPAAKIDRFDAHSGRMSIESQVGDGTTVRIALPFYPPRT